MKKTDLCIIGGFLGAGKTTSILSIAKRLADSLRMTRAVSL